VVAPRGTPEAIIAKASQDLRRVLGEPDFTAKLAARGAYARPMSAAEVTAFVRAQQEMWKPALERIAKLTQ
jgi:tripartite-type tricarboxylate transporter receptor subunit TctC